MGSVANVEQELEHLFAIVRLVSVEDLTDHRIWTQRVFNPSLSIVPLEQVCVVFERVPKRDVLDVVEETGEANNRFFLRSDEASLGSFLDGPSVPLPIEVVHYALSDCDCP
jgi:hypothetical protein